MNQTRLLRLSNKTREENIQQFLESHPIQTLRHYASAYGINDPKSLTKTELVQALSAGMDLWVNVQMAKNE
jgi:hypothetical protein